MPSSSTFSLTSVFPGDGEMAALMRAHDWAATPLGAPETWPEPLSTAVQTILGTRFAMWIAWGPDLTFLYNDAYRRDTLGAKHPAALGRPFREVWPEAWDAVADDVAAVFRDGTASWHEAQRFVVERSGSTEEAYFTFSLSPLPDGHGGVGGTLCTMAEETEHVVEARRAALLRDVSLRTAGAATPEAAVASAAEALAAHPDDLPFASFYLADGTGTLVRAAVAGIDPAHPAAGPSRVPPGDDPRARARATFTPTVFPVSAETLPDGVAARQAVATPLPRRGGGVAGVMVTAVTPQRPFDARFESLLGLLARAVAEAVGNAESHVALAHSRAEATRAADRTSRLQAVTAALAPALTAEAVAGAVLAHGLPALGATAGSLSLLDTADGTLRHVRSLGYSEAALARWPAIPLDAPVPLAEAVRTGRAVWAGSLDALGASHPDLVDAYRQTGYHALAALPLRLGGPDGDALGGIALSFRDPQAFDADVHALADAIAAQAALALERVRLFEAERSSRERATFRTALADALRPLDTDDEIKDAATRLLGQHLGVGRVLYGDIDADGESVTVSEGFTDGMPSIAGRHHLDDFGSAVTGELRAGRLLAVADVAADDRLSGAERRAYEALGVQAHIEAPLVNDGRLAALLIVHHGAPRVWTADEAALVEETAERTWAAVERARAETARRESEQQLRLALDAGQMGVWSWTLATGAVGSDARHRALWGFPPDGPALSADGVLAHVHPDDTARVGHQMEAAVRDGVPYGIEFRIVRPNGTVRWLAGPGRPAFGPDGQMLGLVGVNYDITARKAAEALLLAREEVFRSMANVAPAMLWVTDAEGISTFLSESWYAFTGQISDEGMGRGWTQAVHPDDREASAEAFLAAHAARMPYEVDFRLRRADGAYRWVLDAGRPWLDADSSFLGFVGSVLDVHDRREAEAALRLANETLETRVAAGMADVRALSAALTLAEQRERERLSRVLHDDLQQVLYGLRLRTHTLGAVVPPSLAPDLQAVADLAANALATTRSLAVELAPPVLRGEGLAEALRWLAVHSGSTLGLAVTASAPDDVPELGEDVRVLLFQVARELLLNVAKHAGTDRATLALSHAPDGTLSLRVADDGVGFDVPAAGAADRRATHRPESSGLGLASMRDRLAYRGGTLHVDSAPGQGTCVRVVLPPDVLSTPTDLTDRPSV